MCGICGIYSFSGVNVSDEHVVRRMMQLLEHRGPDGEGLWSTASGATLGHRRLAIIDLTTGDQPQFNETGDVAVILNGEIYNYRELRHELKAFGHVFRTASDTEVLVHGYEQWGDNFVTRLRGMFAFAIWDERRRRMVLGRDRFGVKPLYYVEVNRECVVFASEIKALFAHPAIKPRLNSKRLAEYLRFRSVAGEETLFDGVCEVAPGTILLWQEGRRTTHRYWSPGFAQGDSESQGEIVERGRQLLTDAIRTRLVSDVALGTITSGGLDSSLVSAIAATLVEYPIDTFCVGFADPSYDERPFARLVSEHIKSRHHDIETSGEEIERELDRLTWAHDEPLTHPNSVPMHQIFREAKESHNVTVLLTGEGADEVFGGYAWYRSALQRDALLRVPGLSLLASVAPPIGKIATLKKLLREDYLLNANAFSSQPLVDSLRPSGNGFAYRRACFSPKEGHPTTSGLFAYDQQTYLLPLLQRQDRMSMAAGLEAREPFLDHHLVEWANMLSAKVKLSGGVRKALLKLLAKRWLPDQIVHRRKIGFEMPLNQWFRSNGPLVHRIEALRDKASVVADIMDRKTVERLIAEHKACKANHADILWTLIALDAWAKTFLGPEVRGETLPGAATGKSLTALS